MSHSGGGACVATRLDDGLARHHALHPAVEPAIKEGSRRRGGGGRVQKWLQEVQVRARGRGTCSGEWQGRWEGGGREGFGIRVDAHQTETKGGEGGGHASPLVLRRARSGREGDGERAKGRDARPVCTGERGGRGARGPRHALRRENAPRGRPRACNRYARNGPLASAPPATTPPPTHHGSPLPLPPAVAAPPRPKIVRPKIARRAGRRGAHRDRGTPRPRSAPARAPPADHPPSFPRTNRTRVSPPPHTSRT